MGRFQELVCDSSFEGDCEMTGKEKAVSLFKEGYNCSQSVFVAYADKYGIDKEMALRLSASFGGGMGRMREVCGAVSGMLMVAGLETGATEGKDIKGKKANYDMVQKMAGIYREANGSIVCKELLGLVPMASGQEHKTLEAVQVNPPVTFQDTQPEARTEEYYKKRPCIRLIQMACDIIEKELYGNEEEVFLE